ncbi:MAG: response regulator [Candidatus Buchananbacteria bacterium]|nr:response regulator [Candidatus Buchananbacteria bacterium]
MAKVKILAVEDDVDIAGLIEKKLADSGFEVAMRETGREALDYLQNNLPDLVVLDILLPDIDGLSVLNELAHNPKTKNIPVIIFSNLADEGSLEQAEAIGNYEYLVKAKTDLNVLVEKIKKKLKI